MFGFKKGNSKPATFIATYQETMDWVATSQAEREQHAKDMREHDEKFAEIEADAIARLGVVQATFDKISAQLETIKQDVEAHKAAKLANPI